MFLFCVFLCAFGSLWHSFDYYLAWFGFWFLLLLLSFSSYQFSISIWEKIFYFFALSLDLFLLFYCLFSFWDLNFRICWFSLSNYVTFGFWGRLEEWTILCRWFRRLIGNLWNSVAIILIYLRHIWNAHCEIEIFRQAKWLLMILTS